MYQSERHNIMTALDSFTTTRTNIQSETTTQTTLLEIAWVTTKLLLPCGRTQTAILKTMTMETENQEEEIDDLIPNSTIVTHCIYKNDLERLIKSFEDETDPYKEIIAELINKRDVSGKLPLDLAACFGRLEICRELLKRGANITSISENGYSSLHYAAAWGHSEVLKLLVSSGANIQQKNVHGECPRDTAARYNQTECVNFLDWAGARTALLQFIKHCQDFLTDADKGPGRLNKDEKQLIVLSCKENTEWLEVTSNPTTEELLSHKKALENIVAPIMQKLSQS